jgi:20S proteasome subunit alpha 5
MSDNGGLGCAMSGLIADSRTMVEKGRLEAQHYWFMYNEPITIQGVTQAISNLALQFGEDDDDKEMSRPFGTALLIGGVDEKGPQLYHLDPSGTYTEYDAKAIGSGFEGAQTALQELYNKSITLLEAEEKLLQILKQVMEEKLTATNVEVTMLLFYYRYCFTCEYLT